MMRRPVPPAGGVASLLVAWIGCVLLLAAQFGVRPLMGGVVSVDFALIAVLFAAVRMRSGFAALTGCLVGVILDAFAPSQFGAQALVLSVLAFGASRVKALFFTDNVGLTGAFIFVGKWLTDLVLALFVGTGTTSLWLALLVWAPLGAAVTALAALLLLTLFRPLFRPQRT